MCFGLYAGCLRGLSTYAPPYPPAQIVDLVITAGQDSFHVCAGDGFEDSIRFSANFSGATYAITDTSGQVAGLSETGTVDFEAEWPERCRVYALVGPPPAVGADIDSLRAGGNTTEVSTNFIPVKRRIARTGPVATESGATEVTIRAIGQTLRRLKLDSTGTTLANFAYLITDGEGLLVQTLVEDYADFTNFPNGRFRIYGVGFEENLLPTPGMNVEVDRFGGCASLSSNFITVVMSLPNSSTIATDDGRLTTVICDDGHQSVRLSIADAPELRQLILLTDTSNVIIAVAEAETLSFALRAAGIYRIYGGFYGEDSPFEEGTDLDDIDFTDGSTERTSNFVTIEQASDAVDGGRILAHGRDSLFLCANDPEDGLVSFSTTSTRAAESYRYLITTATDEPVVIFVLDEPAFDFGAVPLEQVRVYALSYTGDLLVEPGFPITLLPPATRCYELTRNFITIFNGTPNAGELDFANDGDRENTCASQLPVTIAGAGIGAYAVIVVDADGRIALIADEDPTSVPLDLLTAGDYKLLGVSYSGALTATVGALADTVSYADVCYAVTTDTLPVKYGGALESGELTFIDTDTDTLEVCALDTVTPGQMVMHTGGTGSTYAYILTDTTDVLIGSPSPYGRFSLLELAEGTYRVYGISYDGELAEVADGTTVGEVTSSGCFALTPRSLLLKVVAPEGGNLSIPAGEATDTVFVRQEGAQHRLTFATTSASTANYRLIVTDTNGVVRAVREGLDIDFFGEDAGACRVYGQSFVAPNSPQPGALLSDLAGCFQLSDNFITVVKDTSITVSTPADIFARQDVSLNVYPNPVRGAYAQIQLNSRLPLPAGRIFVSDGLGRVVWSTTARAGSNTGYRLPIVNFSSGVYYVVYATPAGRASARFIKP